MSSKIKTVLSIFSVTIILACVMQALPKYSQLRKYDTYIEKMPNPEINSTVEEKTSTSDEVLSGNSKRTEVEAVDSAVDPSTTKDYENVKSRIEAVRERINLLNNNITSDLTDLTKIVFNQITEISANPENEELKSVCEQYMTKDFYKRFTEMDFVRESYIVYDIKFSDLDKDDITAYVMTRSSDQFRYFITYSFDVDKNYVISNILQIKSKE